MKSDEQDGQCRLRLFSEPGIVRARQRPYAGGSLGSCSCEPVAGSRRYCASKWLLRQSI